MALIEKLKIFFNLFNFLKKVPNGLKHALDAFLVHLELYFDVLNKLNETLIYLTHRIKVPNSVKHALDMFLVDFNFN